MVLAYIVQILYIYVMFLNSSVFALSNLLATKIKNLDGYVVIEIQFRI